jgi:hypothetical protein
LQAGRAHLARNLECAARAKRDGALDLVNSRRRYSLNCVQARLWEREAPSELSPEGAGINHAANVFT